MSEVPLYRGTSLLRNCLPLGPYSNPMPRVLWWSQGGGGVLMSEVPVYAYLDLATPISSLKMRVAALYARARRRGSHDSRESTSKPI